MKKLDDMSKDDVAKHFNNVFEIDFISKVEHKKSLGYADTDSTYNIFNLPFNKYTDPHKTVDYSQKLAKDCNIKYKNFFDTVLAVRANINPDWNFMDFKSEVIATRGFFNTKKFYALAKIWMEGTFYPELEIKKTGGQILKADSSMITLDFLQEIYEVLTVKKEYKTIDEIKHQIYTIIKNKYIKRITHSINEFNFKDFVIPKKWPNRITKTVPIHVQGSMFFNLIFDDQLRPGDSILMVPVVINSNILYRQFQHYKRTSKYQLPNEYIKPKLNIISFPSEIEFTQEKKNEIISKLQQLDIKIDFDRIINFNITMKLAAFDKLFQGFR